MGGTVSVSFAVRSTVRAARSRGPEGAPQDLLVDLAVHFVKANGRTSPKVFKLKRVALAPGAKVQLATRVSLAVHTTRKPNPGTHAVEVLVNGLAFPIGSFEVTT